MSQAVELKLKTIKQLFNSLDVSPFIEKELDPKADDYIVSTVKELGVANVSGLIIHLPKNQKSKTPIKDVEEAVHNHFEYKRKQSDKNINEKILEGNRSMTIGMLFLAAMLLLRHYIESMPQVLLTQILAEALLIVGWVAMWKPISNILYDWWPLSKERKVHKKLAKINVEFVFE